MEPKPFHDLFESKWTTGIGEQNKNEIRMRFKCNSNAIQMRFKCNSNEIQMRFKRDSTKGNQSRKCPFLQLIHVRIFLGQPRSAGPVRFPATGAWPMEMEAVSSNEEARNECYILCTGWWRSARGGSWWARAREAIRGSGK